MSDDCEYILDMKIKIKVDLSGESVLPDGECRARRLLADFKPGEQNDSRVKLLSCRGLLEELDEWLGRGRRND